jgi:hypothetical protein
MSKFQDKVAKPRTSKGHKRLLDGGRKDLTKHGQPFTQARPVDKSNAFIAKEEHSTEPEEELEEISAMSAGSVAGHVGKPIKKKKKEVVQMESREDIVNEMKLRSNISSLLEIQKKKMINETVSKFVEHFRLRGVISKLIAEADVETAPHASTGINKLEVLLKNIIPTLEDSYKTLTSNSQQRSSFRAHIINAVENLLKPEMSMDDMDSDELPQDLEEVEINIKNSNPLDATDDEKFIDVSDSEGGDTEEKDSEEDSVESFGIEGEDTTGRNAAYEAFNQIENQVMDAYSILDDPNDKEIFYDYLLTNLKMYFDKFEEELAPTVQEPASDSYEEPIEEPAL